MLRLDRLAEVTTAVAQLIETAPLPPDALPPAAATLLALARVARLDVEALIRSTAATSLRSLPSQASADPARADELAAWGAHLLAWLRDERDDPPSADLPL